MESNRPSSRSDKMRMHRRTSFHCTILVLTALVLPVTTWAQSTATVTQNAAIYVRAEVAPTPLRVAAPGTKLRVLQDNGEWLPVEFGDPQFGRRVGWLQRQNVTLGSEVLTPMDLSVDAAAPQPSPQPSRRVEPGPGAAPTLSRAFPGTEMAYGWSFLRLSEVNSSSDGMSRLPTTWRRG